MTHVAEDSYPDRAPEEEEHDEDVDVLLERLADIMLDMWLEERSMNQNERESSCSTSYDRIAR